MRFWMTALALIATAPARAQEMASFNVGGVDFEVPIPKGLCLPTGRMAGVAQMLAAADDINVTHLSLFTCGVQDGSGDYILVKTPKQVLVASITREVLLPELAKAFETPEFKEATSPERLSAQAERGLGGVTQQRVEVKGVVAPRGIDDVCAYMSGAVAMAMNGVTSNTEVSGCLTAIGSRVIIVYYYRTGADPENAIRNLPRARQFALTISAKE